MLETSAYLTKFAQLQAKAVGVTREVASRIEPGMSEVDIAHRYYAGLKETGLVEHWYPVLVYAGRSTGLPISRRFHLPANDVVVQENDIVMLDCTPQDGTVWSNWAETFVVGSDPFYESLVRDSKQLVDNLYDFTKRRAQTVGDIVEYAKPLLIRGGWTSLDPYDDYGHSIFQVEDGQRVDTTPMEDRLLLNSEHSSTPLSGIISIEPQLGRSHPETGAVYSTKTQRLFAPGVSLSFDGTTFDNPRDFN